MGNRPCTRCGKTTWFWADPEYGCSLCVPKTQDPVERDLRFQEIERVYQAHVVGQFLPDGTRNPDWKKAT